MKRRKKKICLNNECDAMRIYLHIIFINFLLRNWHFFIVLQMWTYPIDCVRNFRSRSERILRLLQWILKKKMKNKVELKILEKNFFPLSCSIVVDVFFVLRKHFGHVLCCLLGRLNIWWSDYAYYANRLQPTGQPSLKWSHTNQMFL